MYVSPLKDVRPFARLNLSLSSLAFYPSLIHISTIYVPISLYYTSLVLMILKWRTTFTLFSFFSPLFLLARFSFTHSLSLSLSLSRAHSYSRSFSLSNTGRVLSDKNSSLNKHMIQKLLSYRLTASVKRIVYFFLFIIFFPLILVLSFSFSLPTLPSLYLPFFLSLSTWRN